MKVINYAHRGWSEEYPENTMYSFYMGLESGAKGIETDIQRTKDGVLVLFHDDNLMRILGKEESISDYTYKELLSFDFGLFKGEKFSGEKIVSLEEFLIHFGKKDLTLALEIKQIGIEKEVLEMLDSFGVRDQVYITSFVWDSLIEVRKYDKTIKLGFLTERVNDKVLDDLVKNNIQQICPRIDYFDDKLYKQCRELGLSIRYWGISNDEKMKKALSLGSDGMTINDPSKLQKALGL